ncbi:hypothetical protein Ahy_B10g103642 [Arachis hypogaea]|uniref:Aspartic peptidase DDI1-type domain-containing protein n=1 Tax=Arachis hypogaea TaxID=3818 RepID=A0A444X3S7_ARAHY|nr:hypothetical protein Ahy_B10g103642 [Arachis hypogaea]
MPAFIKYMKELLPRKSSLKGVQTIVMKKECSALIQPELPTKRRDPGSFHIPCAIGETMFDRALCDLGASINLLPLSLVKRLQINEIMPTDVIIRLADKTQKQAIGVVENVLLKVGEILSPNRLCHPGHGRESHSPNHIKKTIPSYGQSTYRCRERGANIENP